MRNYFSRCFMFHASFFLSFFLIFPFVYMNNVDIDNPQIRAACLLK